MNWNVEPLPSRSSSGQELSCKPPGWYHPDLFLQLTVRHWSHRTNAARVCRHCRAAERHWKADQSHTQQQNWTRPHCLRGVWVRMGFFWPSKMDNYWESAKKTKQNREREEKKRLLTRVCVSACVFTLSNVHGAHESILEMFQNEEQNSTSVTEEPKNKTLGCVTKSLAFFFYFWFSIVVESRPVTQSPPPPKKNLSQTVSCHGNFSGQCSPCCCSCSALWDLWYGTRSALLQAQHCVAFSVTNQPTNFCCILSVWTLAGNLRMPPSAENLNSHLYIVLFLMFVRMCGGCVCVYLIIHHPKWGEKKNNLKKQNKYEFNHNKYDCWAEEATSHLQSFYAMNHIWKKINTWRLRMWTKMGEKKSQSLFISLKLLWYQVCFVWLLIHFV